MGTRIKATQLRATSITDLTNTTWFFNQYNLILGNATRTFSINFTSYNHNYTSLSIIPGMTSINYNGTNVYNEDDLGGWMLDDFRTITITGGSDTTNTTLISWLQTNATNQTPTPSGTNHTHLGSLSIIKKHFGDLEVIKETLNGVTIYEKGSPSPSSYQVTFTASDNWSSQSSGYVKIYDGQDNTGTLLLDQTPANKSAYPITLEVTSGYCAIYVYGPSTLGLWLSSNDYEDSPAGLGYWRYTIDKDGTIDISITDFDD